MLARFFLAMFRAGVILTLIDVVSSRRLFPPKILHTIDGKYDESWRPPNVSSLAALAELAVDANVLVAFLDDAGPGARCAWDSVTATTTSRRNHNNILLRNAHRYIAARFLRLATLHRSALGSTAALDGPNSVWPPPNGNFSHDEGGNCAMLFLRAGELPPRNQEEWNLAEQRQMVLRLPIFVEDNNDKLATAKSPMAALFRVKDFVTSASAVPKVSFKHGMGEGAQMQAVQVNWVEKGDKDGDGGQVKERQVAVLQHLGEEVSISSFVGHTFTFRWRHNRSLIGFVTVTRDDQTFVAVHGMLQSCAAGLAPRLHDPHIHTILSRSPSPTNPSSFPPFPSQRPPSQHEQRRTPGGRRGGHRSCHKGGHSLCGRECG